MSMVHGTAVARQGRGVLILGASGSGKSALALQLMALGADLVADDAVKLAPAPGGGLSLTCPANIAGLIEARGVGLLSVKRVERARLAFVVDLDQTAPARLPESQRVVLCGQSFPCIHGKGNGNLAAILWCLLEGGQVVPTDD